MFAMKLMERDLKNFTGDFVARKSVFCFDNRLICLGTDIKTATATILRKQRFSNTSSDREKISSGLLEKKTANRAATGTTCLGYTTGLP